MWNRFKRGHESINNDEITDKINILRNILHQTLVFLNISTYLCAWNKGVYYGRNNNEPLEMRNEMAEIVKNMCANYKKA